MTDTPRVKAHIESRSGLWEVKPEFAMELERENAELKKDSDRLQWLIDNGAYGYVDHMSYRPEDIRAAIDKARGV